MNVSKNSYYTPKSHLMISMLLIKTIKHEEEKELQMSTKKKRSVDSGEWTYKLCQSGTGYYTFFRRKIKISDGWTP